MQSSTANIKIKNKQNKANASGSAVINRPSPPRFWLWFELTGASCSAPQVEITDCAIANKILFPLCRSRWAWCSGLSFREGCVLVGGFGGFFAGNVVVLVDGVLADNVVEGSGPVACFRANVHVPVLA